jgi:hypothetical protein
MIMRGAARPMAKWVRAALPLGVAAVVSSVSASSEAKSEFKAFIPNANVNNCNTCHTNGGDTPRNAFGLEIEALLLAQVPPADWWAQIRELDSDGDLQTNAQELGDPCLTWVTGAMPDRTSSISNPGVEASISMDPDACENPPAGEGEGEGEGGAGAGGDSSGSGMGNGMGNGNGNGNGQGKDRWADPDWTFADSQGGCEISAPARGSTLFGLLGIATAVLLMRRRRR